MSEKNDREIILKGIGASPGICIGQAYLIDREGVDLIPKYSIGDAHVHREENRFKAAVKKAAGELRAIIEDMPEEFRRHSGILEAHMELLRDKTLYGKTLETIKSERLNAEWALKKVATGIKDIFQDMSDAYFKQRGEDISHVSDRIMRNLTGARRVEINKINKRVILVAGELSPAETSQIQLEKIKGVITDAGGLTSHASIMTRSLEIPFVPGLENATRLIKNDDIIIVDGNAGVAIVHPEEKTLIEYEERGSRYEKLKTDITRKSALPADSVDGVRIKIMGNIELPEEVFSVKSYGGDGIGLYRTEFQYMNRADFPNEDELFDKYQDVVSVMAPHPVVIRTLDVNGDKTVAAAPERAEKNPALGLRAIRYCLKNADIFKTQLRAILRASAFGRVRVLFPMISTLEEVVRAKNLLSEAARSLEKDGLKFDRDIETGVMIEVPSAVVMADLLAGEVDFFSVGTNDLIQYTFAIDRDNKDVAYLYNPLHPAIIRMLKDLSDAARAGGIDIFMCGEMAADPFNFPILLGLGLDELSMNPQSIPAAKETARGIDTRRAREFVKKALEKKSAAEIHELIQNEYGPMMEQRLNR
ncbi:Phosphoenolpyruvate-protein phosphotransferase [Candidatus Desulfarcum epimagneticum]|uniref:Phosphoenolpyruvate-protein phosphotransferase n=1 Tax=uncultured Desulfobacteraceae bacterium TaxID=218296 RepID=A0A484HGE4_9BACT|nr:Phosphoenolpyruvate-protein phosphotransferase [uncultured Desulfobacteraceae bacterium]